MTIDGAMEIITQENLLRYNLNENRQNKENEVAIKKDGENWIVFATDEKASMVTGSDKYFASEDDAVENFIKRLRALNFLFKSRK